jgi:hypothetical protein
VLLQFFIDMILLKGFANLSHDDSICDCLETGTFG